MVQVFALYTDRLPDPLEQPEILEGLSQERKQKIRNHKTTEGRRESLGAGLLLNHILEKYGILPEEIRTDENGKPTVYRETERTDENGKPAAYREAGRTPEECKSAPVHFNLSHSGNLVVCAVSGTPVGCDAEKIGPARRKVAKRFFGEKENRYLEQFEDEAQDRAFCRIWTMREAYIKMTGEGMRLDFKKFEIVPEGQNAEVFHVHREGADVDCCIREYEAEGYCISVCAGEETFADEITWITYSGTGILVDARPHIF